MAKQTFTTGQVLTAAQQNSLQANDFNQTVSVKTANYSLLAADKGTRIEFNTSGSVTCTVNSGEFDAGDTLIIQNRGAGTATITAGTATVNTSASLALAQYSAGTLYFVNDSAALFFGDAAGISASLIDAKGDLIVGTADNTVGRLAAGTNGYTLVADSTETTGLKWAAPAGGGKVLQVVQAIYNTAKTIASTSYTDTDLTLSITPSSATSKVLVMVQQFIKFEKLNGSPFPTSEILGGTLKIVRGVTDIYTLAAGGQGAGGFYQDLASGTQGDLRLYAQVPMIYLDSPATTSATTYKTQGKAEGTDASGKIVCQSDSTYSSITLMEIGA